MGIDNDSFWANKSIGYIRKETTSSSRGRTRNGRKNSCETDGRKSASPVGPNPGKLVEKSTGEAV